MPVRWARPLLQPAQTLLVNGVVSQAQIPDHTPAHLVTTGQSLQLWFHFLKPWLQNETKSRYQKGKRNMLIDRPLPSWLFSLGTQGRAPRMLGSAGATTSSGSTAGLGCVPTPCLLPPSCVPLAKRLALSGPCLPHPQNSPWKFCTSQSSRVCQSPAQRRRLAQAICCQQGNGDCPPAAAGWAAT